MTRSKKEKKKMGILELIFTVFSLVFLIGFTYFYGYRMFYYKNLFSPKSDDGEKIIMLSDKLKENIVVDEDGLYNEDNIYVYKGTNVNNYVMYSNMLFRIIKINKDNSIEMILDSFLNYLYFDDQNTNFNESDLNKYLNNEFYNNIKSDMLIESIYCNDTINDINNIICNDMKRSYVKLLSLSDYLNSKIDDESYLNSNYSFWLNSGNDNNVWLLNDNKLSLSKSNLLYSVRPVITLNNLVKFGNGDGSLDNPYIVSSDSLFGSYVKLDNDLYRVYDINDSILKLQTNNIYGSSANMYHLSKNSNLYSNDEGLGLYLNSEILNNFSYKDILVDCDTYIGEYNNYESVYNSVVSGKIGITSIIDPIFNIDKNNYYLSTPYDKDKIYIYNSGVYSVKPNIIRNINLSICIDKSKLVSGDGTLNNPYLISEVIK